MVDVAFQSPNYSADGMVGYGFQTTSALGKPTFFDTIISDNNGLPSHSIPFFSMYLEKSAPQFIIGSADTSKFSGTMVFVNLVIDVSILRDSPCLRLHGHDTGYLADPA